MHVATGRERFSPPRGFGVVGMPGSLSDPFRPGLTTSCESCLDADLLFSSAYSGGPQTLQAFRHADAPAVMEKGLLPLQGLVFLGLQTAGARRFFQPDFFFRSDPAKPTMTTRPSISKRRRRLRIFPI